MDLQDRESIRREAAQAMAGASQDPRRLSLVYGGVLLGSSLLITVVNFFLAQAVSGAGGLSGLGTRAILETVQSLLQISGALLMPVWEIGFLYAMVQVVRGNSPRSGEMLRGFHRLGSICSMLLLQGLLLGAVGMLIFNFSSMVFMMTPLSIPFQKAMEPMLGQGSVLNPALLDQGMLEGAMKALIPMLILFGVIYLAAAIPILYRLRLAQYLVMEDPKIGGLGALTLSNRMMKGHCKELFRLDLGFWWYYLLQTFLILLCYGDGLLRYLGVSLPIGPQISYFLFYGAYLVLELGVIWGFRTQVECTYGVFYDRLRGRPQAPKGQVLGNIFDLAAQQLREEREQLPREEEKEDKPQ